MRVSVPGPVNWPSRGVVVSWMAQVACGVNQQYLGYVQHTILGSCHGRDLGVGDSRKRVPTSKDVPPEGSFASASEFREVV